jgi:cellulose synthase/poly-beta-1,6-N-acetylglucosamine synthase-like glycosyltransferase
MIYNLEVGVMSVNLLGLVTLTAIFLVIYHHLFYPLILSLIKRRHPEPSHEPTFRGYRSADADNSLPKICLVIPAYNEADCISAKIHNLAILDYPRHKLQIILACDGCTDRTAEIAKECYQLPECEHLNLEIREYPDNRGKVAVINDVLKGLQCEVVALSDVSALVSVDALLIAAARFKEREIGVVNGHYQILNPGSEGEANYWLYQSRLKSSEAVLGSTLGAHGAFYLFRRSLFNGLAEDTINDDFILPMEIVAQGYRAAQDNRIMALELEQADDRMDRQRRKRISAGNLQQVLRLWRLFLPRYGGVAFAFASGKGLRVLMPFLMFFSLAGSLLLATDSILFAMLTTIQLWVYLLAAWELIFKPEKSSSLSKTLSYIVSGHLAGLAGTLRYVFSGKTKPLGKLTR